MRQQLNPPTPAWRTRNYSTLHLPLAAMATVFCARPHRLTQPVEARNRAGFVFPRCRTLPRYPRWRVSLIQSIKFIEAPFHSTEQSGGPRYYQRVGITHHRAIAKVRKRLLPVMATGTRQTYTAFQSSGGYVRPRRKKRILFLADERPGRPDYATGLRYFGGVCTRLPTRDKEELRDLPRALPAVTVRED